MSAPAPAYPKSLPKLLFVPIAAACAVTLAMVIYGVGVFTGQLKVFGIPTKAMSPTIEAGESIFATKFKPVTGGLSRGQCVVFDASGLKDPSGTNLNGWWVKRIVALPGDTVSVVGGAMRVNDILVERSGEPSIAPSPLPAAFGKLPAFPIVVPAGQVFVMGDNYKNSLDSRYIGPVSIDRIKYRPLYRISPVSRMGKIE